MFKNKTLFVWTISLIAIFILAACGGQAATQAATEAPQTQLEPAPAEATASTPTKAPAEIPTETSTQEPASADVSFANDIAPIIQSRCINCHGGQRVEKGLVMRSYEDLMAGSDNGLVVIPGDPENSLFVQLVTEQKMPKKGPKLTPPQIQLFYDWVLQGALNN